MTEGTDLLVRVAAPADAERLVAFNLAMALETEGKRLDPARLRAGVEAVLADPSRGTYLVAERARGVVGGLLLTFEWSDWRNGAFWWIQSVYVEPAARRGGVYRALHREVERRARATPGVCGLRLYVEGANERAQRTYESLGMARTSYRFYETELILGG